jgi:hypothetical protein
VNEEQNRSQRHGFPEDEDQGRGRILTSQFGINQRLQIKPSPEYVFTVLETEQHERVQR